MAVARSLSVWFSPGRIWLIGWSVVFPTLLGAAVGIALDERQIGTDSWTRALTILGLFIGCVNAWNWVGMEGAKLRGEQKKPVTEPGLPMGTANLGTGGRLWKSGSTQTATSKGRKR